MSKEVLLVVEAIANEKAVDKELIFEALESALATATCKKNSREWDVRVSVDRSTGEYETFRRWTVVEDAELEIEDQEIVLSVAKEQDSSLEPGDVIEESMESIIFGRIAAQTAKRVIIQKVHEAERQKIADVYRKRLGELVVGTVKRVMREGIIVDFSESTEGFIPRGELLPHDTYRVGDSVKAFLYEVCEESKGPQLFLSRARSDMLSELFKIEVPEIADGIIALKAVARDPGSRAKIAVSSRDQRIDPVGACVGIRGSRVQAVSNELRGERIDVVLWDDDSVQLVINAMSPAELLSVVVDEDDNVMDIAVNDEQLSQAIGRNGQNVRLASELTGWELNVMSESKAKEAQQAELDQCAAMFVEKLGLDEKLGTKLAEEGFSSLEEVAYVPKQELLAVEGFDEELIEKTRKKAKDVLLVEALAEDQDEDASDDDVDVGEVEGVTEDLAKAFRSVGIKTRESLAEHSVDDLLSIVDGISEEQAGKLIMSARAHWFSDESKAV